MMCCGKERTSNFCPQCGKPMNKEAGLIGLKAYIDDLFEKAVKKEKETKANYDERLKQLNNSPHNEWLQERVKENKKKHEAALRQREKFQSFQEALIRAIDGE